MSAATAVTAALDAEIASIEADIRDNPYVDPRQQRLDRLRAVRRIYLDEAMPVDAVAQIVQRTVTVAREVAMPKPKDHIDSSSLLFPAIRQGGRKPSPERVRALKAVYEFLIDKTEPVRTSVVLEHLVAQGIEIAGEIPANNLSAMLSNDERFASYGGRRGWMLKQNEVAA